MGNDYQPFSTISGNYQLFNYLFYYTHKFNKQPNIFRSNKTLFSDDCLDKLSKNYKTIFEFSTYVKVKNKKDHRLVKTTFAYEKEEILIYCERAKLNDSLETDEYDDSDNTTKDALSESLVITILYNDETKLEEALKLLRPIKENNKHNIFLICGNSSDGYFLKDFHTKLPKMEMDVELNYGKEFAKKHKIILNRLKKENDTGLLLLIGKPGTGKTTYIKYLTTLLDKKIIFVPPSLAEGIAAPSFLPFLMDYKNSILVIEDAEKVVASRESGDFGNGVSNILNMTDGILGDCLNIQIIATLNTTKEKIDPALLRKGRLISEHEFKELPIESVQKIFEKLKIEKKADKELTLTDIYNFEEDEATKEEKPTRRIGFSPVVQEEEKK